MSTVPFPASSRFREVLSQLYGEGEFTDQAQRYARLRNDFKKTFGNEAKEYFSTPGRTELGGNHTDHNHGRVLAASVHLDSLAAVSPTGDPFVRVVSQGFPEEFRIDLARLDPVREEEGTTTALIRGVAAGLNGTGRGIGGFNAYLTSRVASGSGLSSSASIEVLIGTVFNHLFNGGTVDSIELAKIGRYAENRFFNKPCGLMDQIACAHGGVVSIDFFDPEQPVITGIPFDFARLGYTLAVVHTGGAHDDLTPHYTAVFSEMQRTAEYFGRKFCREVDPGEVIDSLPELRGYAGDRAVLRYFHFADDNDRVSDQVTALQQNNIETYLRLVNDSGESSWKLLQNCYIPNDPPHQSIPLALTAAGRILKSSGALRVHGGGFAGTIQAYVPSDEFSDFSVKMEKIFGPGSVTPLSIRNLGSCSLDRLAEGLS